MPNQRGLFTPQVPVGPKPKAYSGLMPNQRGLFTPQLPAGPKPKPLFSGPTPQNELFQPAFADVEIVAAASASAAPAARVRRFSTDIKQDLKDKPHAKRGLPSTTTAGGAGQERTLSTPDGT